MMVPVIHITIEFVIASSLAESYEYNCRLREGFQVFDKNGDGKIDANEMKAIVGAELGEDYLKFWTNLLNEVDKNGNGKIDFYEFKDLLYPIRGCP